MGVIARRLAIIERQVNKLEDLARLGYEHLSSDEEARMAAERRPHISLEALIDVGLRIVSSVGLGKPEKYRDLADVPAEKGVIPRYFGDVFERMISFRNVLVHLYAELHPERVYEAVMKASDIKRIASDMARYVYDRRVDP